MANDVLIYLAKVATIQGVFMLLYWGLFNKQVYFGLNRIYLLGSLVLSVLIPFFPNPFISPEPIVISLPEMTNPVEIPADVVTGAPLEESPSIPVWQIVGLIWILVVLVFLLRSFLHLWALRSLKTQSEYIEKSWFRLFKTEQQSSFSFFKNVFIPGNLFGSPSFNPIVAHECVHVRQWHSLDRLLVDLLVSLFWFNPFIYLYRKALIEVHEFQADAEVVKQYQDTKMYQEVLYHQLQYQSGSALVSHFNFSMIKKRIVMMNTSKNKKGMKFTYLLVIPVAALLIYAFTSYEPNVVFAEKNLQSVQSDSVETKKVEVSEKVLLQKQSVLLQKQRELYQKQLELESKRKELSMFKITPQYELLLQNELKETEKQQEVLREQQSVILDQFRELTKDKYDWSGSSNRIGPNLPPPPMEIMGC